MSDYREAGVNIDEGNRAVELIKKYTGSTFTKGVLGDIGGFSGLFEIAGYKRPVLVAGTDGVGTKLKIAIMMNKHDTVGIDCVAMCVNDVICQGAMPIFFLDYIGIGKLYANKVADIVRGVADGCRQAGCALIGGETAELPGIYSEDDYDLAGFCVGIAEYDDIIDGKGIRLGDMLIGLPSSGIHSNGYSLVRHIFFNLNKYNVDDYVPELGTSLGEELLKPTRIYVDAVKEVKDLVKGISHITGGGFIDNIPRAIPDGLGVKIFKGSYEVPCIFKIMEKLGEVPEMEMYRTFNMGIGMVLIVSEDNVNAVLERLKSANESAYVIGTVTDEPGVVI